MNKKIALSAVSILAALALVGGATFAFFSDENTSEENIFAAGDLVLELDDVDETFTPGTVSGSIGGSNMAPGDSVSGFVSLHNGGSVSAAEVVLGANAVAFDPDGDLSLLSDVLDLTVKTDPADSTCVATPTDHTAAIAAAVGDGVAPLTLSELVANDYNALAVVLAGDDGVVGGPDEHFICVSAEMESTAGNIYQGDSVDVDFVLTANQDVSQ